MKAVVVTGFGGPRALEFTEVIPPIPDPNQVLVDVHVAGVSFPDALQTRGLHQIKHTLPFVPGSEFAGTVVTAPRNSGLRRGQRVVALGKSGGFAEQAVADVELTLPLPDNVSFVRGASLPANYLTARHGLMLRGAMQPGESVLVHGAGGGVGTAAVQVARAYGAGRIIAVASTPEKAAAARESGADDVVGASAFKDEVLRITDRRGVDIVVDPVGGDRLVDSLRALADNGRILVIGFAGGGIPTVKVNRLLLRNLAVIGVNWGAHAFQTPGFARLEWSHLLPFIQRGEFSPPIGRIFELSHAGDALDLLERRATVGKLLLTVR